MPDAQHRAHTSRCSIKASLVQRKQALLGSTELCPTYILIMPFIKHLLCTRDHLWEALQVDSARVHMAPSWAHQPVQHWLFWPCCHARMAPSQAPTFPGTAVLQQLGSRSGLVEEATVAHSWQDNRVVLFQGLHQIQPRYLFGEGGGGAERLVILAIQGAAHHPHLGWASKLAFKSPDPDP